MREHVIEQPVSEVAQLDGIQIARDVAADVKELYGERLRAVVLFGSWARGDQATDSDIDLLVVLDRVDSRREELGRMSDILWRHSLQNDTAVTELPVSDSDYRMSDEPILVRARAEGITLA